MAYLAQYQLSPCPYCGKDAVYYSDRSGETYFYIATCEDRECEGFNEHMFDDRDACCNWWNRTCEAIKAEQKGQTEPEEQQTDSTGANPAVTAILPIVGENTTSISSLAAVGTDLDDNATFVWTIFFSATVVSDASTGHVLHMTPSQAALYNVAATVRASVTIGDYTSDMFTIKG